MCATIIIPAIYITVCYFSSDLKVEVMPLFLAFSLGASIDLLEQIMKRRYRNRTNRYGEEDDED